MAGGIRKAIGAEPCGWINPHRGEECGREIFQCDGIGFDVTSALVGFAIDGSSADAGTRHHCGIALRPVVAADAATTFPNDRRSAELANEHDQSGIQQPAGAQVFQQRRDRLVRARQRERQSVPAVFEDPDIGIAMHVPRLNADKLLIDRQPGPGDDIDQSHTGLDQASGKQKVLPQRVPPVAVSDGCLFLVDIKSCFCGGTMQ